MADFRSQWKGAIEDLATDVGLHFTREACRREVLKSLLTQLLLYYQRFLDAIKEAGPPLSHLLKEAVPVPSIMYELKRFK